jgi:hypothetical protein
MLFSRSNLLRGTQPLQAASRVVAASASATSIVARCWVRGTNRTFALVHSVRKRGIQARSYAARASNKSSDDLGSGPGVSFYGAFLFSLQSWGGCGLVALVISAPDKLVNAWKGTPTKWYPIPIAVGALLLVAIRYRKKSIRVQKEVQVDKDGREVIKLRGPWQVCVLLLVLFEAADKEITQSGIFHLVGGPSNFPLLQKKIPLPTTLLCCTKLILSSDSCARSSPPSQYVSPLGLSQLPRTSRVVPARGLTSLRSRFWVQPE